MIGHPFRRLAVLAVASMCLFAASACGGKATDAATVSYRDASGTHTVHITTASLLSEVSDVVGNAKYRQTIAQALQSGDASNTTDARFTAYWLSTMIDQVVVTAEFDQQHLKTTPDQTSAAEQQQQQFFGSAAFSTLPKSLQKERVNGNAQLEAVLQSCPSGRLASHLVLRTEPEAQAVFKQLEQGGNFATLAKSKSIDTTSGPNGGVLGCLASNEYQPTLQNAFEHVPFDTVAPVRLQGAYDLVLVRRWDPSFASNQQIAQSLQQAAGALLDARLNGLKVWVNPRFGKWGLHSSGQQGAAPAFSVAPPSVPNPSANRG